MQQLEKPVDWYDEVCQRLEMLHVECHKTKDCEDTPPPDFLFEVAKKTVENLRPLIGFTANLPVADVWLGPEGEIGLTWDFDDEKSVDLIFTVKSQAIIFTDNLKQLTVKPQDLPSLLAQLAA